MTVSLAGARTPTRARPSPTISTHAGRRGGGRNRQDDRARQADPACPRDRAGDDGADRRGHVHREGGRRAEAAAARGARARARATTADADVARRLERGARDARRGARQHDSRLLRRAASRTAGRGVRRSAVRACSPSRRPTASTRARSGPGSRRRCKIRPRACAARCAARARRSFRRRRRRRSGRSAARRRPDAGGMARFSAPVAAAAVRSRAPRSNASSRRCTVWPTSPRRRRRRATTSIVDTDAARRLSRQIKLEQSFGQRDLDGWEARLVDLVRDRGLSRTRKGSGYKFGETRRHRTEVLAARDALFTTCSSSAGRRRRPGRVPAAGTGRRDGALSGAEAGGWRARLHRPAGEGAGSDQGERGRPRASAARSSRGSSSTSSRTPIRFRPRFCCCSPSDVSPASCSSSAIRSRRSTGSAGPTSRRTGACATNSCRAAGATLQLTTSYRSVPPIQRFVNAAFERRR